MPWWRWPTGCSAGSGNWIVAQGGSAWFADLSFQRLVGYLFAPFMFLLGIPWNEALTAGGLFGTKLVLNEFVAFIDLGQWGRARCPSAAGRS